MINDLRKYESYGHEVAVLEYQEEEIDGLINKHKRGTQVLKDVGGEESE
jgi:hypothetical protein